jgi:hypothetical protein
VWTDGKLLLTKALVERLDRLKIEIRIREHAPPHFHVTAPGIDASFTIENCALLRGTISGHDRQLIEYWHKTGRRWNETRPSNCPVGPIEDILNAGI